MDLKTKRLTVRSFEAADWQDVYQYVSNSTVMKYLPENVLTEEQTKEFIKKEGYYAVEKEKRVIGHISFIKYFGEHTYEIGWVFHPDFYNQGYATEAAQAIINYGFNQMKLHRIVATCQPENIGSFRVMEKLAMRKEGLFKKCIPTEDGWWDEYYYAILAEEWTMKG